MEQDKNLSTISAYSDKNSQPVINILGASPSDFAYFRTINLAKTNLVNRDINISTFFGSERNKREKRKYKSTNKYNLKSTSLIEEDTCYSPAQQVNRRGCPKRYEVTKRTPSLDFFKSNLNLV